METDFAPLRRTSEDELAAEIEFVGRSAVLEGVLHVAGGLLDILNRYREIVAVNDTFLRSLGVRDPGQVLGLRPGEALDCVHAREEPGGCGTTKYCSSCGAAIAIVSSLGMDRPVERVCVLEARRDGSPIDLVLAVRSHPIRSDGHRFLLLFLRDVTREHQRAALERTFFHDVNNLLSGMVGASEILASGRADGGLARTLHRSCVRLAREVAIQRCLLEDEPSLCRAEPSEVSAIHVWQELQDNFEEHPAARHRRLIARHPFPDAAFRTDETLLLRVLGNMVTNALEATEEGGEVEVWFEQRDGRPTFYVRNRRPIPDRIAAHVFQRNFTTKDEPGRGIGTFAMKLIGERFLGGTVDFTSSWPEGTVFRFALPA